MPNVEYHWPFGAAAPERVLVWPQPTRPHVPYRFAAPPSDETQNAACADCRQPISRTRVEPWVTDVDARQGECPGPGGVKTEVSKGDLLAALTLIALHVAPKWRAPRDALDRLGAAAETEEWR